MDSPRAARVALFLLASTIVAATLHPTAEPVVPADDPRRLPLRLSDPLRNLFLFAPLGAALVWARVRPGLALLLAGGFSAGIELAQRAIPGRYASPLDVVTNTLGAGLGIALSLAAPLWLDPPTARARQLALGAAATVAAVFFATGALFAPAPSGAELFGHRPPELAHLPPFPGRVLAATLEGAEVPSGDIPDAAAVRAQLAESYTLRVDAVPAAPLPDRFALFAITNDRYRNLLLLRSDGDDLVLQYRSRSEALGLEPTRLRVPAVFEEARVEDPLRLLVRRAGRGFCIELNEAGGCGHGFTVGDGWLLVAPHFRVSAAARPVLAAVWVAALFLPVGYWGRGSRAGAAGWAAATAAALVAPAVTGLLATPVAQLAGGGCGTLAGIGLRRTLARSARGRLNPGLPEVDAAAGERG